MAEPRDILSLDDYKNYRNVRAVSRLFVLLGSIIVFGGIMMATVKNPNSPQRLPPAAGMIVAVVGLAGAVGGVAALLGSRRWAPLVYVMATLYVFAFPLGTILSYVILSGLRRYLDSVTRVRKASSPE